MATDLKRLCLGCMNLLPQPGAVCSICGWPSVVNDNQAHLPPGTRLKMESKDYLIGNALGQGGFGIVYVAWDVTGNRKVAIKELFPESIVKRTTSYSVAIKTSSNQNIYDRFLKNFHREFQNMIRFNNNVNTVSVLDYIEANGTAYIVMEFIQGHTLSQEIVRCGGRMPLTLVLEKLSPVFSVLEHIHQTGLVHRDISPDNIMFEDGSNVVKLMDFGAAREWDPNNPTTVAVLKEGYAPPEQYLTVGIQSKKGTWTDVYALAATIYYAITGIVPPNSNTRTVNGVDLLKLPSALGIAISPAQEGALMKGLSLDYNIRYQTVRELFSALNGTPQPLPSDKRWKKILPYVAAAIAIIASVFSYQMKIYADQILEGDYFDLKYAADKSKICHSIYNELKNASNIFYNDTPVAFLKAGTGNVKVVVTKEDGNKNNITSLHFHLSSNDISAKWGSWNDAKKTVECTIYAGTKKGCYTVTFYDSKNNASCVTLVIVE